MEAARAASALPAEKTSTKCCALPAPPEAITGIETIPAMAAVSSQSKPMPVPSRSMEVSRISPAPRSSASRAQASAFLPVGLRPPATKTSAASAGPAPRRASMATITACEPKRPAILPIRLGSATAAELMLILSAPASKTWAASSSVRMPPPTVKGTNISRAARRTVSVKVLRSSWVAVMSSSTISSAPASACARASSAGSPASRSSRNFTPLTTRPASTSRQAMIRLVSRSEGTEVLQDFQPCLRGFLGMKLHAKNILALNRRGEASAVLSRGDGIGNHRRAVGVCVIDERAVLNSAQQARAVADIKLVPPHMRRLHPRWKARALSGEQASAGRFRRLRAGLKQPLHPYADSPERLALRDGIQHRLAETAGERPAAPQEAPPGVHHLFSAAN